MTISVTTGSGLPHERTTGFPLKGILWGGFLAGVLCGLDAMLYFGITRGIRPILKVGQVFELDDEPTMLAGIFHAGQCKCMKENEIIMWKFIGYWVISAAIIMPPAQTGSDVGDYRGLPADLASAATAYDLAQFKSDRAELERLLADDYTLIGPNGRNLTKAQDIADALVPGSKTLSVTISQQVRKVWPGGAVLGGIVDARKLDRDKTLTIRARFVDIWAKRNGRWQVIFTQVNNAN